MARKAILAAALLGTLLGVGGAAAATKLTSKNSISWPYAASTHERFAGTNCGGTAAVTKRLPAGATGITVVKPKVGARDVDGGGTRVTAVNVAGTVVTITVLADGPSICDPALTGYPPGAAVAWIADYDVRIDYRRRVQTVLRVYYESYIFGAKWKVRPRTIRDSRRGAPPGARVSGIRWKQFGGRKAIGYGRLRQDYCRRGDRCPQNGKRIRLVATNARYCKDSDKIEYRKLDGYIGRIAWFGGRIECSR